MMNFSAMLTAPSDGSCRLCGGPVVDAPAAGRPWWCAACRNTSRSRVAEYQAEVSQAGFAHRMLVSGMPRRFVDCSWSGFRPYNQQRSAMQILAARPLDGSVWLAGPVGTGKSRMAAMSLRESLLGGVSARWMSPSALAKACDRSQGWDDRARGAEAVQAWSSAGLLVIDDIGRSLSDEHTRLKLESIIEARWDARRPVIVTSNATIHAGNGRACIADSALAQPTIDRLRQMVGDRQALVESKTLRGREQ